MKAGILKEKIDIYKQVSTTTKFGNVERDWCYAFSTKTCVLHKSGNMENASGEMIYSFTKQFILRSYIEIDENMRIKYKSRFYRILDVADSLEQNDKVVTAEVIND